MTWPTGVEWLNWLLAILAGLALAGLLIAFALCDGTVYTSTEIKRERHER